MQRTLHLTSPVMRGGDVLAAQRLLAGGGSKFGNFKAGPIDGDFGEQTAGACRRAKFWLGYPSHELFPTFGSKLQGRLRGTSPLPLTYRVRRAARIKAAGSVPLRERAFKEAVRHVGTKESPPDSNRVLFTSWYGLTGAWCAMFVTYCYVRAGSKRSLVKGVRYAYTPFMVREARLGVNGMSLLSSAQVKRGDVVMFDWGGAGRGESEYLTDHTGLFDRWVGGVGGAFKTCEGNTSFGNDSNGGEVMRRERSLSTVSAFIRAEV